MRSRALAVLGLGFLSPLAAQITPLEGPVWTRDGDLESAGLGRVVAGAGDVNGDGFADVLVAAPTLANGTVYLYLGSAAGLAATPAWSASGATPNESFGEAVAGAGDVNGDGYDDVVIGGPYHTSSSVDGRALLYLGSAAGLGASPAWEKLGDPFSNGSFGNAVAGAGDVNGDGYDDVAVGASALFNGRGEVRMYFGSALGLPATHDWSLQGDQGGSAGSIGSLFGTSVSSAGDVNGDGFDDLVVGAEGEDNGHTDEGAAYLYLGSSTGPLEFAVWGAEGNFTNVRFGLPVTCAGDVNGDGKSDVAVSAHRSFNGEVREGRTFVYLGRNAGLTVAPASILEPNQSDAFQAPVSGAGDVNGDGYSDLVVGAGGYTAGEAGEGRIFLHLGSATGLEQPAVWTFDGDQESAGLGPVAVVGDVNGDGYADVVAGASGYDDDQIDEGRVFLFFGRATALAPEAAWTTAFEVPDFAAVGATVALAGDVNGDGHADALVGAPRWSDLGGGHFEEGRAFLYPGAAGGPPAAPGWTVEGDQTSAHLGTALAGAGDVDGDGYDDVLVGAPDAVSGSDVGLALLYRGGVGGLASTPSWSVAGDHAGTSLASAGDVNGDGWLDVIVGAPTHGAGSAGRALLYLGTRTGLATTPAWSVTGASGAMLGSRVAYSGDVDADGFGDVAVASTSQVSLYLGSRTGPAAMPAWSTAGRRVAPAGDVDGDGFSDLAVGDPFGAGILGTAAVFHGSASGPGLVADWSTTGTSAFDTLGAALGTAGDVDGDGYGDLVVGIPNDSGVGERAWLFRGSLTGLATLPDWIGSGGQSFSKYGGAVAGAGDVDGDGYGDVLIGAPAQDTLQDDVGQAFLYLGNEGRGGWTRAPRQLRATRPGPIAHQGRSDALRAFRVRLDLDRSPKGSGPGRPLGFEARLEWQVAPLGVALDGVPIESGPLVPFTGAPLALEAIARLGPQAANVPYHWRARVRTNHPSQRVTPWTWLGASNVTEAKVRRGGPVPEPDGTTPVPLGPQPTRP